jgi:hypothetical protein
MDQPVTHPEWGGNQLSFASGQLGESEKPVEVMDSNNGDGYSSRPCTSAGGLVASTAVNVSITL